MKRIILILALMLAATGLKAQNCEAIMLPYFKGDVERMQDYRDNAPEKFQYRCTYARAAFVESDTIPAGLAVFSISEVQELATGKSLSDNFKVDLNTLSYYAYNFSNFQFSNGAATEGACFRTPGSSHPYLILRSLDYMGAEANRYFEEHFENQR